MFSVMLLHIQTGEVQRVLFLNLIVSNKQGKIFSCGTRFFHWSPFLKQLGKTNKQKKQYHYHGSDCYAFYRVVIHIQMAFSHSRWQKCCKEVD